MDETAIACIEEAMHLGLPLDVEAMLIIEADGSDEEAVAREIEAIGRHLPGERRPPGEGGPGRGGEDRPVARPPLRLPVAGPQSAQQAGRGHHRPAQRHPGGDPPHQGDLAPEYGLPIVIFGHAGDGNLHPNMLFDKRDPEQWAKVEAMVEKIFRRGVGVGGHALW